MASTILGLNAYHGDSSACLVRDGQLVAAAEEERFRRIKHWAGFPAEAIRYCLSEAGAALADVDHVAVNQDPKANLRRKVAYSLRKRPEPGAGRRTASRTRRALGLDRGRARARRSRARSFARHDPARRAPPRAPRLGVHACSPFEDAARRLGRRLRRLRQRGVGRSATEHGIEVDDRVYFPHSLGIFYQAMTQFLGFPHYGDEYKVMGLAPYGEPTFADQLRDGRAAAGDDGGVRARTSTTSATTARTSTTRGTDGAPTIGRALRRRGARPTCSGPRARAGRAAGAAPPRPRALGRRRCTRRRSSTLLERLHGAIGTDALVVAGGCGMNSVANGKVSAAHAVHATSTSSRRPATRAARSARRSCAYEQRRRRPVALRHGPRLLGPGVRRTARSRRCSPSAAAELARRGLRDPSAIDEPRRALRPHGRARSPTARSSAGSRGAWSGARARSATARSSATRAAPT